MDTIIADAQDSNNYPKKVLVIGTGLASYGTCLGLLEKDYLQVDVIDIGLTKPYLNQKNISVPNSKDINGSFFPYGINDKRWSSELHSERMCSSHAYGGYSKAYSGSILQPKNEDLKDWPLEALPKAKHYSHILSTLQIDQKFDELNTIFPLNPNEKCTRLPKKSYLGYSRIAKTYKKDKQGRINIYPFDCSEIFNEWIDKGKIKYYNNRKVISLKENKNKNIIVEIEKANGNEYLEYEYVFLAAGCINTTAIVDISLYGAGKRNYTIKSAPFLLQLHFKLANPLSIINWRKLKSSQNSDYALCKYFLEINNKYTGGYWSHTQIGDLNRIIIDKLKSKLPKFLWNITNLIKIFFQFSISVFHSSQGIDSKLITEVKHVHESKLIQSIKIIEPEYTCNLGQVIAVKCGVFSNFKKLLMLPIPFSMVLGNIARGNKLGGWHYGATLPFSKTNNSKGFCKVTGQLNGIQHVFVTDASTFPSIPGSSVALLTMTNAYRIAAEANLK
ncbi:MULTISPECIES: GMC oxidoreductase [Prochlorococcus]|uniref:GMC oxidoreductase n=1 Tax=Prochlorococcus TaxID=1218 RepID=UPI00053390FB|nr:MULTISPECIES: GMC oxidoreductase [Prochlorococcus]KGG12076.1 hypothetical protein EV05_1279 [Prochlorococcus sp. MIT 0601]